MSSDADGAFQAACEELVDRILAGDVGEDDVEGEPPGALESELREDRNGVSGRDDSRAVQVEDAEIDAVSRADDDVVAVGAEIRIDDRIEELPVYLAEVGHTGRLPANHK